MRSRPVCSGDVVLFEAAGGGVRCGRAWIHALVDDVLWTCIAPWAFHERRENTACYVVKAEHGWVLTSRILEPVVWHDASVGQVSRVIIPATLRETVV